MAADSFPHIPLPFHGTGPYKAPQFPRKKNPKTKQNLQNREEHAAGLSYAVDALSSAWRERISGRESENLPPIPTGVPLLLEVDPDVDIDFLRASFGFEIVAEYDDGFVLVATEEFDLEGFRSALSAFAETDRGGNSAAQVYSLDDDDDRLRRILAPSLYDRWPEIKDDEELVVDVSVECLGTVVLSELEPQRTEEAEDAYFERLRKWEDRQHVDNRSAIVPVGATPPRRRVAEPDAAFDKRKRNWELRRDAAYAEWDDLKMRRESDVDQFVGGYGGIILQMYDNGPVDRAQWPDSFTVRMRIPGKALRDLALNYPFVWEVDVPDEAEHPQIVPEADSGDNPPVSINRPPSDAPTICIIDSGIQEEHRLLEPAIDSDNSYCFVPGEARTDVADYVRPGGHGTRVAGAALYGECLPVSGDYDLPFWIQNARVLDRNNDLPSSAFPPSLLRAIVDRFYSSDRRTRIYNHSVSGSTPCRRKHMSAWAASIDLLSFERDVLFIQSTGNVTQWTQKPTTCGILDHLAAGRQYQAYLFEDSGRVSNPAQSLQAITVGSVAYSAYSDADYRSIAGTSEPSSFTKTGLGIWGTVKPDVVEYGGDWVIETLSQARLVLKADCCPLLVRSTLYEPIDRARDGLGTSFAAPKVARIAALLQATFPDEPTLLYRALIAQSARWPQWAEPEACQINVLKAIGYGIPDLDRATTNNAYRISMITSGAQPISARDVYIYRIRVPDAMRNPADSYDIRIDVTLSYVACPRRTRKSIRGYLSTWVDWTTSKAGESLGSFVNRVLKEADPADTDGESAFPWTINESSNRGSVRGVRRALGTLQKDWAIVKSHELPEDFCIAVIGHKGWSSDPELGARFSLVVTFEAINEDVQVYESVRTSVEATIESEAQTEIQLELF